MKGLGNLVEYYPTVGRSYRIPSWAASFLKWASSDDIAELLNAAKAELEVRKENEKGRK